MSASAARSTRPPPPGITNATHASGIETDMLDAICAAIRGRTLLEFDYDGLHRVVAPYCHGFNDNGEVLRAIQVGGQSRSPSMPSGKLWTIAKMQNVRDTAERFVPRDPRYNPNDSAMTRVHCNV